VDLRDDRGKEGVKLITGLKVKGLYIHCDVSNGQQVQKMVDEVISAFGKIDILAYNAAISPPENPIAQVTEEEWDEVLAVNLMSAFLCCKRDAYLKLSRRSVIDMRWIKLTLHGILMASMPTASASRATQPVQRQANAARVIFLILRRKSLAFSLLICIKMLLRIDKNS
jgi:NAD(P)-dependent dehydrogenase (short-subunit alcohol dehydrogenase family)